MAFEKFQFESKKLFEIQADVYVIPHSVSGTIKDNFRSDLFSINVFPEIPLDADLGDIHIQKIQPSKKSKSIKYIIYACCVEQQHSTYAALWKVSKAIALSVPKDVESIACPLLGTGAGNLNPILSYHILLITFYNNFKTSRNVSFVLCHPDPDISRQINSNDNRYRNQSGRQIAFDASIDIISKIGYNKAILEAEAFYFDEGKKKYLELKTEWTTDDISLYNDLLYKFKKNFNGFASFLHEFTPASKEYRFLLLCGQLISYIDSNAANKLEWNKYSDKRTMARSGVRQTIWIECLLRFKINNNSFDGLPQNVLHALEYLENPAERLMMLSDEHRKQLCENLFRIPYDPSSFHQYVINYFNSRKIYCKNPINTGALVTRILYSTEVVDLWLNRKKKNKSSNIILIDDVPTEHPETDAGDSHDGEERYQFSEGSVKAVFHSDRYANLDLLDYELYAKAIQEFLTLKDTQPPLTIGIMAPWGKGKTTLMKFIEKKLKAKSTTKLKQQNTVEENKTEAKVKQIQKWLNDSLGKYLIRKLTGEKIKSRIEFSHKLEYPVVWFNAWRFLKNQEVWSAFGHEIINQLVDQLPSKLAKEEFWFKLHLTRIDSESIRTHLYKKAFSKILLFGAFFFIAGLILIGLFWNITLATSFIPFSFGTIMSVLRWHNIKTSTPDIEISKFLSQPEYKKDMGYVYKLENDLVNVFKLLVKEEKPATIFIDDLDRCSPSVTVEIVEAINLFISSENLKCFFILGQDAQMVAASLDVAYEKVEQKLTDLNRNNSLGWSFMEKFLQLQFSIPVLTQPQRIKILSSLMSTEKVVDESVNQKIAELREKFDTAPDMQTLNSDDFVISRNELQEFAPKDIAALNEKILERTAEEFEDNNVEIQNLVDNLGQYLAHSPRSIKNFVNLYRFYRFLQASKVTDGFSNVSNLVLGQWVLVMIRWPFLIRSMQWNESDNFLSGTSIEKAQQFNLLIDRCKEYTDWCKVIQQNKWNLSWLEDKELFAFVKSLPSEASFDRAFENGIF